MFFSGWTHYNENIAKKKIICLIILLKTILITEDWKDF